MQRPIDVELLNYKQLSAYLCDLASDVTVFGSFNL